MISFTQGNLLEADVEAVVNTVNTVGIMGKGIALMFKEQFPQNFEAYARACEAGDVRVGKMFVTENEALFGPRWLINFPTKQHWRSRTRLEWVEAGLEDLVRVIREREIRSVAVPPLGCGNGGLDWRKVRPMIVSALDDLPDVDVLIFEPTGKYQNVAKRSGVEKLTPARALVAEMVRRYCMPGIDCSILEVQKLGWFLERGIGRLGLDDPLGLEFQAHRYGPYSHRLTKLLDSLDGSYLRCDKRLADASPMDLIWFDDTKHDRVCTYLNSSEGREFGGVIEWASSVIDGYESPLGMELLATLDWLFEKEAVEPTLDGVKEGLKGWAGGTEAGARKMKIFDDRLIELGIERLSSSMVPVHQST